MDHARLAGELMDAERTRAPFPLFTERYGSGFTWADARRIAKAVDQLRLAAGDELMGYKLGWTSRAMREALRIAQPNWGTLWASQQVEAALVVDELIAAKVEPELVCRIGDDIEPDTTLEGIEAICTQWTVGLEVVAPRFGSFSFGWLDNTADNSSAARFVVGDFVRCSDPGVVEVVIDHGSEIRRGKGSAAMGSPLAAIHWLVNALAREGQQLRSGQIVLTGGLTAPFDLCPGTRIVATAPTLGVHSSLVCL